MKKKACLLLLLFCLLPRQGNAAPPRSLAVGETTVALGASAQTVLQELSAKYEVHDLGGGDYLVLQLKSLQKLGGVKVSDGKIVRVSRSWADQTTKEAATLAESLWAVLANAVKDSEASARIVTQTVRSPADTYYDIQIIFSDRRISMTTSRSGTISLSETIE